VLLTAVDGESDVARAEQLAGRCGSGSLLLLKRSGPLGRAALERWFIGRGWRRSPVLFQFVRFEQLNDDHGEQVVVLERLPPGVGETYPPAWLQRERDLHMDMTREAGSRSDAHLLRYAWACQFVRRGDRVLDIACGMGYGSYLVRRNTEAGLVLGADNSATSIRYAKVSFRTRGVGFRQFDAESLRALREARFDVVLSFETLEHLREPEAFLQDVWRLLRPCGRVIVSVPNDWSDETGKDPNPYHFQVYTLEALERQIGRIFAVERWASECSDRVKADDGTWKVARRSLDEYRRFAEAAGHDAEWWLACAMKSPVGATAAYTERAFTPGEVAASGNVLAFPRDYANAWLVRGLVTMGLRAANEDVLEKWSRQALESMHEVPVDKAALLCVLLYRALERLSTQLPAGTDIGQLQTDASALVGAPGWSSANPTAVRWRVSLAFALAQVKLLRGEVTDAAVLLDKVARSEVSHYSVLLHSKTLGAAFQLAAIRAADEPKAAARELLASTRKVLREVSLWVAEHLSTQHPDFFFREIAEIVDTGLRNFNAAKLLLAGVGVEAFEVAAGRSLAGRTRAAEAAFASAHAELRHASSVHAWLDGQYRSLRQLAEAQDLAVASKADELARAQEELATTKSGKDWLEEQYLSFKRLAGENERAIRELTKGKQWLEAQYQAYKALYEELRPRLYDSLERGREVEGKLTDAKADGERLADEVATLRAELDTARQRACELESEKRCVSGELVTATSRIERFRSNPLVRVLLAARLIKDDPK
jgi:2-polyprenyl-3-methyl-5-hydroxy-6-metoxy-1,4-benzoquinol methylase